MDGIISLANGSSSSLYGCIGCAIKDLIMSKFPREYFKYTSVSSELASRNIRRTFGGANSSTEIKKRLKPYLIIQPSYSAMDQDGPLQGIPLTKNFDDLQYRTDKRYLFEVIRDKKYGYNLKFKLNRDRIDFDVTVTTSTLHHQLDIYRTILNQIIWDRSYAYRMALESVIPKKMIAIMSKYCNMDLEKTEEHIPILLRRLNSCSGYPITYKLRNASATDEWFMYYTHNVIVTFSELSLESGNKKNMADDYYNITFRVSAEFNMPGVYFIDGDLDKLSGVDITLRTREYQEENDSYFPLYTVNNLYSRFPVELNGMQLYGSTIFQTNAQPGQIEDRIDVTCVLDNDHIRAIRAHKAWNMNPDTLLNVYVLKDNDLLVIGKDYNIDWNTLEIVITNIDNASTYRLLMYFNYGTVNEILNNTTYDRNYDVNTLTENSFPDEGIIDEETEIFDKLSGQEIINETIYDEDNVPEDKKDDPNIVILTEDPTYDAGEPHGITKNDDSLLSDAAIVVDAENDRYQQLYDNMVMTETSDTLMDETTVLEDDATYDADEPHGIDISEISIEGIETTKTTADIYNSMISKKKRFSSSK